MKYLYGKNVLITGAGSGIGRVMALDFARNKANLALVDINPEALEAVEKEVKAFGVKTGTYVCDISKRSAVAKTVKAIRKDFNQIDILVNNAGIVIGKSFVDLSLDEMHRTMDINFWGHVYFTKEFLPDMIQRNDGHLVNIASSGGLLGMTQMSDYGASKFAEVGFSESLRRELYQAGAKNVKVTVVCPYTINTGMFEGFKPLWFNPILKAEYVGQKVVEAVKKDKPYLYLPYLGVKGMLVLKLLPTALLDWSLRLVGGSRAMNGFVGRGKQDS
ncbi:MAG TPA: SDR family NAD(P)-dependent oxidoreductase [Deltaproteobacteria bacterium]|nr:SDR family NAD(P)-dependent oxidoreductase [Deltaproteobacteria bacterium]